MGAQNVNREQRARELELSLRDPIYGRSTSKTSLSFATAATCAEARVFVSNCVRCRRLLETVMVGWH